MPAIKYYRFLRGTEAVLAILLAVPVIMQAGNRISPWSLMEYFGIFILISGTALMISAPLIGLGFRNWQLLLMEGLTGVIIGIFIISGRMIPFPAFFTMAGIWTLVKGFFLFLLCRRIPEIVTGTRNLLFIGVLSIPAGILLIWHPVKNAPGLFILLGIYTMVYGLVFLRDIYSGSRKEDGDEDQ
jgi:uncharacterized membrane protein HdeD (DUF308 family)